MGFLKKAWSIYAKDMVVEYRTRERLTTMFVFTLVIIIIFNFAFDTGTVAMRQIAPGMMWVAFTFAGMLGVNRSFVPEKEEGSFDGLLLAPMDRGAIYLGKLLGNLTLIGLVELLSLPLFALFLNIPIFDYLPGLLLVFALGTVGFASIGTLFAAMAVNSRMREVMLPILLFPLASPILIAAVETTGIVFRSGEWDELSSWISLLATFMIVFLVASLLLFEYILEE